MAKGKLNDEVQERICKNLAKGAPYRESAINAGITEATFWNWYNRGKAAKSGKYKKFYLAVEEAKTRCMMDDLECIGRAAENGNWQAAAWRLERRNPEDFGRRDHLDARVEHTHLDELTDALNKSRKKYAGKK